ncbi:unnamed protein product [Miscanthus lutarioriparius]|uniref:Uncharacterized protein n=1 Tax=Miscanthus lutarioriparius TaxID=422564 RepID=A0A811MZC0_9POAL|nr:unnamed protein product [Miscanthus lutarioriparius]
MASAGRWAWMAEVAGEELAKLEAAHPGRFGPLKAELERLVADPGLDEAAAFALVSPRAGAVAVTDAADTTPAAASSQPAAAPSRTVPVCTQVHDPAIIRSLTLRGTFAESSTRKRKPRGGAREREEGKRRRRASTPPGSGGAKDRADMAIERAQRCLERIRAVKQSLLAAWIH